MNSQALLDAITADTASHITFLQSFIRAPSPNPPGDTREAARVIAAYLSAHDIDHQVLAAQETLDNVISDFVCGEKSHPFSERGEKTQDTLVSCGPDHRRLIMNGHIDVFPAGDGHDWDRSPWSGELVNGRVHGRGGVDMKAGTAASVIAYTYLHRYRVHLAKGASVGLTAVSDEETGGRLGTRWLLQQEQDDSRTSRWGGDVMINAEPGGLNTIRFAEKGTLRLTFTVHVGPGAHGAYTHLSKSATRIAAQLICDLAAVENIVPDMDLALRNHLAREDVRDALDACMGAGAADMAMKCTLNIGSIHGGFKVNMIPGRCVFEADIRMPLGLTTERVMGVVHGILDRYPEAQVTVQEAASNPAAASPHDHCMVDILARQAERVIKETGVERWQLPVAVPSMGATDCKHYRYAGVPAYVFGVSPTSMGAANESVSVEEFLVVIKTHALAAWEYLGGTV